MTTTRVGFAKAGRAGGTRRPATARLAILSILLVSVGPGLAAQQVPAPPPVPAAPASPVGPGVMRPAEGLENWRGGIDLSAFPPGKYNLVVEGVDAAGNATEAQPMNVWVDPASDLPRVSIVNPNPLLRVGGDLNIVGTCVDDDGVARVEVQVDGGEWSPAEGGEFWALYLRTASLAEGRRSLAVRGVDVNGLAGPPSRVQFDLDRTKPLASVTQPAPGSLVAGQFPVTGSLTDANGLRSLESSLDGKNYGKVELRMAREATVAAFSFPVDSRKLPDGPLVIWLRSVDGVGSSSTQAFLVVVDNTKPSIEVARPAAGAAVNGRFVVAGAVRDAVGVRRLAWEFAGTGGGEIPLTKGDPFFSVEFDSGPLKGDKAEVVLVAEDSIGNVTRLALAPRIDRAADKPVLSLLHPAPGGRLGPGERILGSIRDDDGAGKLRWSLDGGAALEAEAAEGFSLALPEGLASGKHLLSLTPVDREGLAGDALTLAFSLDKGPGEVRFLRLSGPGGARDFLPGAESRSDAGDFLEGEVLSPNPLVSLEYAFGGAAPRALEAGKPGPEGARPFRVALDATMPYGSVTLSVRAKDAEGRIHEGRTLLYATNLGAVREDTGFRFADLRLAWEGGAARDGEPLPVAFGPGAAPILGAFHRERLASLRLEPPTPLVRAGFDGGVVRLEAAAEGRSGPTRLVGLTDRGHEFTAGPFVFSTDSSGPTIEISSPAEGAWSRDGVRVSGRVGDPGGLDSLTLRVLPAGEARKVAVGADGAFALALPAAELPQGAYSLELSALDLSGNPGRAYRSAGHDSEPPAVVFLSPEKGAVVRGPEDAAALVRDASGIESIEFAPDGKAFAPLGDGRSGQGWFAQRVDLAAFPSAAWRLRDRAGNVAVVRPEVVPGPAPAVIPSTATLAVEGGEGEGGIELAGASGGLQLRVRLPALPEAAFAALGFAGDGELPARFATRLLLAGAVSLKGQATAPAPIKALSLSLDAGATWLPLAAVKEEKGAKPSLAFSLSLEAGKLRQGENRLLLRIEDFRGGVLLAPLPCLVDGKAPSLVALHPPAGTAGGAPAALPGPFPLVLRVEDAQGAVSVDLGPTGGAREAFDLAGAPRYLVRVVDPGASKTQPLSLAATARDAAGNVAQLALRYAKDAAGDAPRVELDAPSAPPLPAGGKQAAAPPTYAAGTAVAGRVVDDDGPAALRVLVDGSELGAFAAGSFALALPALAPGKHVLTLAATDPGGAVSELRRDFLVDGPAPAFLSLGVGDPKSLLPYAPGLAVTAGASVGGRVEAPNGLVSVLVVPGGGPALKAQVSKSPDGSWSFVLALPAGLPPERLPLRLRAEDARGLVSEATLELHLVRPSSLQADDAEGLRFADPRLSEDPGRRLLVLPGERVTGRFNGRPLASVRLSPDTPFLKTSFEGSAVYLEAGAEGLARGLTLVARTVDGDEFAFGPFDADVDSGPPALVLSSPADGDWAATLLRAAGSSSDPNGLASLELAVEGGTPVSLIAPTPGTGAAPASAPLAFDRSLPLEGPDGTLRVEVTARDRAGRETRVTRVVSRDATPPILTQVLPAPGESVNGLTTFVGEAADSGRLASVAYLPAPDAGPGEPLATGSFSLALDLARLALPLPAGGGFVATDRAGNRAVLAPELTVDRERDKPVAVVQAPLEDEVMRGDFVVAGVAFDDDGLAAVWYRFDSGEWTRLPAEGSSFALAVAFRDQADNGHLFEAQAEDLHGVRGDIVARKYRVSREEPLARLLAPSLSKPVRGRIELSGTASDANGVESVSVSVDGRASYGKPVGGEAWKLGLDTAILADGLHPVAVRPVDAYGTEGFYASIITVDNSPPRAALDLPLDGEVVAGAFLVSGRVSDNLGPVAARIEIAPLGAVAPPGAPAPAALVIELGPTGIVRRRVDLSALKPGPYSLRLVARDRAENETLASRDITLAGGLPPDRVDILFPLEGDLAAGRLRVEGRAVLASGARTVAILADGVELGRVDCDSLGYFSFEPPPGSLTGGERVLVAATETAEGRRVASPGTRLAWSATGPWVSVDSHSSGAWLGYRPWLEGSAGRTDAAPPGGGAGGDKAAAKAAKALAPLVVELSLDNGRSWAPASGTASWRFRLETLDLAEGKVHVIVRARFGDGATAVAKRLFLLDKTPPELEVLGPREGGRYNGVLEATGTAYDASGLSGVSIGLRKGDKSSYELPAFIQGLYLDASLFGATSWATGLGLTFFDDNVKLQAFYGQAPEADAEGSPQSFYGGVFGAKLIANLAYLPFNALFGPDWDFLSLSAGLGANFAWFSETQTGTGLIVSSVFGQLEFPKVTLRDWKSFRTFSLYTEFQVWVLSSVVSGGFIPRLSFGARVGIF